MNKPGSPALRRSRNLGGHPTCHLREKSALQVASVSHESFRICVFFVKILREIRVVGIGHPVVGVLPRSPMN